MSEAQWDAIWLNAHGDDGRADYGAITLNKVRASRCDCVIAWWARRRICPSVGARRRCTMLKAWITPGLIDCHTHIVYAGNRSHEFEARLNWAWRMRKSRVSLRRHSCDGATRAASEAQLYAESVPRV